MRPRANRQIMQDVSVEIEYTDPMTEPSKRYEASWSFKLSLSIAEQQAVGRLRRQVLGVIQASTVADDIDLMMAQYQAEIQVRSVNPPSWWIAKQGDDLPPELIRLIGEKMTEAIQKIRQQRLAAAEEARKTIRTARQS